MGWVCTKSREQLIVLFRSVRHRFRITPEPALFLCAPGAVDAYPADGVEVLPAYEELMAELREKSTSQ